MELLCCSYGVYHMYMVYTFLLVELSEREKHLKKHAKDKVHDLLMV